MRHAITLSALGMGTTSPNPPVGCVVLDRHGTVAGAGFHRRKGEAHAEVHALTQAGTSARGGTAVVTLEPCNHVGVSPACRQELLDAGIARVVIGMIDPTSRGDGGAAVLAAAGVDIETGVLSDEVLTVLGPWHTATVRRRPYLIWAQVPHDEHDLATEEELALTLRSSVDLVLRDEIAEEGVPGGHASQHFALPGQPSADHGLLAWLSDAHAAGTRSVLLVGSTHAKALQQDPQVVDEVVVTLPRADPQRALATVDQCLMPRGFQVVAVTPFDDLLMIRFRRPARRGF